MVIEHKILSALILRDLADLYIIFDSGINTEVGIEKVSEKSMSRLYPFTFFLFVVFLLCIICHCAIPHSSRNICRYM